jgi:hypothetical protein
VSQCRRKSNSRKETHVLVVSARGVSAYTFM